MARIRSSIVAGIISPWADIRKSYRKKIIHSAVKNDNKNLLNENKKTSGVVNGKTGEGEV